jgi:hypothetical protein
MDKFHNQGLYFETKTTSTKKIFKVSFPIDALLSLRWNEKELKKLNKLDQSDNVADKLEMMSLIARKLEGTDGKEHHLVLA